MKLKSIMLVLIAALMSSMGATAQVQDDAYLTPSQARKLRAQKRAEYEAYLKQEEAQAKARKKENYKEKQNEDALIDFYNRRGKKRVSIEQMNENYNDLRHDSNRPRRGGKYASRLRRFDDRNTVVIDDVDQVYVLDDVDYDPYFDSYYGYDRRNNVSINIGFGNRGYWNRPYSRWSMAYGYYSPYYDPWGYRYAYNSWWHRPYYSAYYGWGYDPFYYDYAWGYDPFWDYPYYGYYGHYYSPYRYWGGYYYPYYGCYYGGYYGKTYKYAPHGRGGYPSSRAYNRSYETYGRQYGRVLNNSYRAYSPNNGGSRYSRGGYRDSGRSRSWSNSRSYRSNTSTPTRTYRSTTTSSPSRSYNSSGSNYSRGGGSGNSGGARGRR